MRGTMLYLNIAHFLDHYFLLIFPTAVLAIHPMWGMSYGEALTLGTPAFVAFALATPVSGWLGDRFGEAHLMGVFFLGIGLASIATGLAAGPVTLAIGLAAIGLFASIYHPVGTAFLVRVAQRTGAALGVNGVFGNLGVAAAAGLTGIISAALGWRAAFIMPGCVALAIGIAFVMHVRDAPASDHGSGPKPASGVTRVDQIRVLVVVGIAALFGGLVFNGVTIALPKLFEERLADAAGLAEIGLYASAVFAIAAFTQIPAGRAIDRLGAKPVMMVMTGLQILLFLAISRAEGMASVLIAVPLMLAVFGEVPVTAWLVSRYVAPQWRGRVYSLQFLLALGVSAGVLPLIAILHGRTGSQAALFVVLAFAIAVVFAAAWLLPGWRRAMPEARPVTAARPTL